MGMNNRKVVITGDVGFIGANLARELPTDNNVIIVDDLSVGMKENLIDLSGENFEFVEGSIGDISLLKRLFRSVDSVFHQAAISSVAQSVKNPLATNETNVTGTLNVLLAARDNGVNKVIYASSEAVYGDTTSTTQREDIMPNPPSPYAVTKLVGEYYCQVFQAVYDLPTVSLRYFDVYGPNQDPRSEYRAVIPKFIKRISEGKPPIILDDGEQTRDFVFVSDIVLTNILAAESDATGVFNIGHGQRAAIN
jgi:UDP-glucose 4-epimerase